MTNLNSTNGLITKRPIVVIKIGTSTLMRSAASENVNSVASQAGRRLEPGDSELAVSSIALVVDAILSLRRSGYDVILVTSGAVGVGCREMGVLVRPIIAEYTDKEQRAKIIADIQAYAAIGQGILLRTYDHFMHMANQKVAQVLLTSGDLGREYQYHNAKSTISALLAMGVVPVVNENDTVATEEIKYGDNDWLSALVSTLTGAEWLFLLTDVPQLYTANPRLDKSAKPIDFVPNIEALQIDLGSNISATGTRWGTGGMATKITAARLATAAGVRVCLVHGRYPSRILDFVNDNPQKLGTLFEPLSSPISCEKRKWISNCLPPKGEIWISEKATTLIRNGAAIKTKHVTKVTGEFEVNSAIKIFGSDGLEMARGLCAFDSEALLKYMGKGASQISEEAGSRISDLVVLEDNIALLVESED